MRRFFKILFYVTGVGLVIALLYHIGRKLIKSPTFTICMSILAGAITLDIYLWRKFWNSPLKNSVVIGGVILTLVCGFMFAYRTSTGLEPLNTLNIQSHYFIDRGLFQTKAYMEYQVVPTPSVKPDNQYMVTISNNLVRYSDKMKWSELELAIKKPLIFKHELTQDEYAALTQYPTLSKSIALVYKEHNPLFIIIPLLYGGLVYTIKRRRDKPIGVFHEVRA